MVVLFSMATFLIIFNDKPFQLMWLNTLTPNVIQTGIFHLRWLLFILFFTGNDIRNNNISWPVLLMCEQIFFAKEHGSLSSVDPHLPMLISGNKWWLFLSWTRSYVLLEWSLGTKLVNSGRKLKKSFIVSRWIKMEKYLVG